MYPLAKCSNSVKSVIVYLRQVSESTLYKSTGCETTRQRDENNIIGVEAGIGRKESCRGPRQDKQRVRVHMSCCARESVEQAFGNALGPSIVGNLPHCQNANGHNIVMDAPI
jgi:hypothetical protein